MVKKINLNFTHTAPLPSPSQLFDEMPIMPEQLLFVTETRRKIIQILEGSDPRLLLIVGPCSIHDLTSAKEYASKLQAMSKEVSDSFLVIMRVYCEKPRTTTGWKGLLYDPHLDGSKELASGLRLTRQLLLEMASLKIPVAAELLEPLSCYYFSDLISWACIGARTSESQVHRQMASGLPMPVGFKNTTSGNVDVAIEGIISAKVPHNFIGLNENGNACTVYTTGNPYSHIVLRGGKNGPNYDADSIAYVLHRLEQQQLPQKVIIDCSHDNSRGNHERQPLVFQDVMHQILGGERAIRGMILESHLFSGCQPISNPPSALRYAVSLTDSCLDWQTTEHLILSAHKVLSKENQSIFSISFSKC